VEHVVGALFVAEPVQVLEPAGSHWMKLAASG